jgi:hypothetical protein
MCGGSRTTERCVHRTPKGASGRPHQPRGKAMFSPARLSIFPFFIPRGRGRYRHCRTVLVGSQVQATEIARRLHQGESLPQILLTDNLLTRQKIRAKNASKIRVLFQLYFARCIESALCIVIPLMKVIDADGPRASRPHARDVCTKAGEDARGPSAIERGVESVRKLPLLFRLFNRGECGTRFESVARLHRCVRRAEQADNR